MELGEEAHKPDVAARDETAVILAGILLDRGPVTTAIGSRVSSETGDAALVLAAYLELGEAVLPLLRGSFGLIIWDGRHCRLLCARDPTDSHPLFFSRAGGRLLVSASHAALLQRGRVRSDFDRAAIARWVLSGATLPRRTFYAAIERLPPGHVLTAERNGVDARRYWHPAHHPSAGDVKPGEAVERLEELLDQAVRRCARLGPMGVLLSGGVDSAVVAASATVVSRASSMPDPLALSYVYPDADASEEAAQRSVASGLGLPHRIVPLLDTVGAEGLLAAALRLSERAWMPCLNPWEPAFVRLAEYAAERGCHVILSGEGGNDWFEAQWYEAADLIRRLRLVALWRLWAQESQAGRNGFETARDLAWSFGGRVLVRDAGAAVVGRVAGGALRAIQKRRLYSSLPRGWAMPDDELRAALADEYLEGRSRQPASSYRESANDQGLEGVHLVVPMENRFLFSSAVGARFLNPAVDPDLIAFLYALPNSLLNQGGRGKGLAWESVRRRAGERPAATLGFATLEGYLATAVRAEGPRALEEMGGLERLSALGVVDACEFARAMAGSGLDRTIGYHRAWRTLACEAWLRKRVQEGEVRD